MSPPEQRRPAGARRGRGRPRDPETDKRIIAAATELMTRRGFERMTVDDVASQAGVGKATVYRRWPSKDDLAVAAMEELYAVEFPDTDTGSIRSDLQQQYRDFLAFVNTPEGEAFIRISVAESVRDERITLLYRQSVQRREDQARRMFERAVARGEVRGDVDVDAAVQWLPGLVMLRLITNRRLPAVSETDRLVDMTLRGIRGD
jgi:AcrR family transcriptional regulator